MQKAIYILQFLLLTTTLAGAQSFGLPGTAWEHCWTASVIEFPPAEEVVETRSGPTFERNIMDCNTFYFESEGDATIGDSIVICRDGDKVFYLEEDSSYLLYDFSLREGDTLVVRYPHGFDPRFSNERPDDDDFFRIAIDSVTTESIMGVALLKQHIHVLNAGLVSFGSFIQERLGFEYWVLPYYGLAAIDGDGFIGLRSYMDDDLLLENEIPCEIQVSARSEENVLAIEIYPNPAHDHLIVDAKDLIKAITIYDLTGRSVSFILPQFGSKSVLKLDNYVPGIYFAEVRFDDRVKIRKFVVRK